VRNNKNLSTYEDKDAKQLTKQSVLSKNTSEQALAGPPLPP